MGAILTLNLVTFATGCTTGSPLGCDFSSWPVELGSKARLLV